MLAVEDRARPAVGPPASRSTASNLKKSIEARKYNLTPYKNPLAVIHTILKRLVQSDEVKVIPQAGGKKAYQWISTGQVVIRNTAHRSTSHPETPQINGVEITMKFTKPTEHYHE